jgi:hypothetical protein
METWNPTGLRPHFEPRRHARRLAVPAPVWRVALPAAVAVTVLFGATVSSLHTPAPSGRHVLQVILGATTRAVTPANPPVIAQRRAPAAPPAPADTHTAPARPTTVAPVPAVAQPAPSPEAMPAPTTEATAAPAAATALPATPTPVPTPTPRLCLPLNLLCL